MRTTSHWRAGPVALGAVALCVALVGCTSEAEPPDDAPPVVQLGGPGESGTTLPPDEVAELGGQDYTPADVEFVAQMIPHHQQALEMTALVPDRAGSPDLDVIAERIEVSQVDEIAQLENWLTERGQEVPGDEMEHGDGHDGHDMSGMPDMAGMPGMATPRQLDRMEGSRGARFDRLFLEAMIRHHEGAIIMVETLLDGEDGGQESAVFQLASHIATDQAVEIAAMKRELGELTGS